MVGPGDYPVARDAVRALRFAVDPGLLSFGAALITELDAVPVLPVGTAYAVPGEPSIEFLDVMFSHGDDARGGEALATA